MEGYKVTIINSSKDLTVREKIKYRDVSAHIKLDEATAENPLVISYDFDIELQVHNEFSKDDKDYTKFVIVDTAGTAYQTGSRSFITALRDILDLLKESGEDTHGVDIEVYQMPSKNRQGKNFITCTLA